MIVCSCNVLTDSQVRAVADQHGSLRTAQVHCSLGYRPRCGRCFNTIRTILESKADGAGSSRHRHLDLN